MDDTPRSLTMLLRAWRQGDQTAFDEVAPLIYDELRRIAATTYSPSDRVTRLARQT